MSVITPRKVRFDTSDQRLQQALRASVDAYFEETGLPRHATPAMWAKLVFWLGGTAAVYGLLVSGVLPALWAWPLTLVLGVCTAAIGFNVGHDAIHGALSDKPWVNAIFSRTFDVLGASSHMWSTAHNFVHHTYTNVPDVDHDLDPGPFMVFQPRENPPRIYRLQHLYAFALYFFTHIVWVFKKDFQQMTSPDPRSGKRVSSSVIAQVVLGKVAHFGIMVAIPMAVSGYAWWQVLIGYATSIAMAGLTLAVVFQLAHVVEVTAFPRVDDALRINDSWAAHQLKTTANFAPTSPFWNFFTGGLNHQVEHHLFYKICHIHYPALAPRVREVAASFGVPYYEYETFTSALASHVRTMRRFGYGVAEQLGAHASVGSPTPSPGERLADVLGAEPLPAE